MWKVVIFAYIPTSTYHYPCFNSACPPSSTEIIFVPLYVFISKKKGTFLGLQFNHIVIML